MLIETLQRAGFPSQFDPSSIILHFSLQTGEVLHGFDGLQPQARPGADGHRMGTENMDQGSNDTTNLRKPPVNQLTIVDIITFSYIQVYLHKLVNPFSKLVTHHSILRIASCKTAALYEVDVPVGGPWQLHCKNSSPS